MVFQKLTNEQKLNINAFMEKNGKEKASIYRALVMRGVDSKSAEKTALARTMGSGTPAANAPQTTSEAIEISPKKEPRRRKTADKENVSEDVDMVKAPAIPKPKSKGKVLKDKFEKNQDTTVEVLL